MKNNSSHIEKSFLEDLKKNIPHLTVVQEEETLRKYNSNTLGETGSVSLVVYPATREEVQLVITLLLKYSIHYSVVSCGNNWGFGSRNHTLLTVTPFVSINLSQMNNILSFDKDLGLITVEPGVTLQQLKEYLEDNNSEFMSPLVGSGGGSSVLGNLLDKGHAINPYQSRVDSLVALEAVLADGTQHSSYKGSATPFYSLGAGPLLDRLFVQSSLGIVTKSTLQLFKKIDHSHSFLIPLYSQDDFSRMIPIIRNLQQTFGTYIVSVRYISLEYFVHQNGQTQNLERKSPPWFAQIAVGGERGSVTHIVRYIKKRIKSFAYTDLNVERYSRVLKIATLLSYFSSGRDFLQKATYQYYFLRNVSGEHMPTTKIIDFFLRRTKTSTTLDEDVTTGVLMFHSVVPIVEKTLLELTSQTEKVKDKYSVTLVTSFSSISPSAYLFVGCIIFDKSSEIEKVQADKCYHQLLEIVNEIGGYVHRIPVNKAKLVQKFQGGKGSLYEKIKNTLDKDGLYITRDEDGKM